MNTPPAPDAYEVLDQLVRTRRSVRKFTSQPVPDPLLAQLVDTARWAPSGYNLQPVHFTVVTDPALRAELGPPCFNQTQLATAPAIVILSGDRRVVEHQWDDVLAMDRAAGAIDEKYEKVLRGLVRLSFGHGPLGLGWLWKTLGSPAIRLFSPLFPLPAVHKELWLTRQTSLSAMAFMLAAQAVGLATVPMEGFDPKRVARILRLPAAQAPILVIPVGYGDGEAPKKTRLPVERLLHWNRWEG